MLPDSVLAGSLQRILTENREMPERYSAFQNAL
jgi:FXSXX-COOH protein